MKKLIPFLIMLLFTLVACSPQVVVVTVEVPQQAANDSSTIEEVEPTTAPETNTDTSSGSGTTVEQPTATPVPIVSTSDIASCKLPTRVTNDPYIYQLLGIPRPSGFVPSTGTVEVAVIFVDFSDARATTSPEQALGLISPFALSQYFSEVSYGQMELVIKPYTNWLTLSQPAISYREILYTADRKEEDEINFVQEAVNLADPNVDFSKTDAIILIGNPQASDDFAGQFIFSTAEGALGVQADGTTIHSGILLGSYLVDPYNAELLRNNGIAKTIGQTMSLQYLQYGNDFSDDPVMRASSVGSFSIMGTNFDTQYAPGMFAFERWQLGWVDDGQIVCQTGGEQTTDLSAIENAGGTKAVIIPLGEREALVVESRRAVGTDQELVKEGVLVYLVDTSLGLAEAPIRVLPMNNNDLNREQAPLAQGESLTHCNITITNVGASPNGDSVNVSINGPISCKEETASTGQDTTAQPTTPPEPTKAPEQTGPPEQCADIPEPDEDDLIRVHVANNTNDTIYATQIRNNGEKLDDWTYSAEPGEYIWYTLNPGAVMAVLDKDMEIIQMFMAGEEKTQCQNVTSQEPDETGKLVFVTFTNGTSEPLYLCRENEAVEFCGLFYAGDSTSPTALFPGGVFHLVGQNSGTVFEYVATDAENQATTISK